MIFFIMLVFLSVIFCPMRANPTFSSCANEPKSHQTLDEILLESQRSQCELSYPFYRSLDTRAQCESKGNTCSSKNIPLLQKLWHLLHDFENRRECTFGQVEWNRIINNIEATDGKRSTNEDQPDVFIIPNFLTQMQCEELVKTHEEISNNISTK